MSATSGVIALAREREVKALRLRIRGKSYEEIGQALGISRGGAYLAVLRRLRKLDTLATGEAVHLRCIESERLLFAMDAISLAVQDGDTDAVREWRQLSESMRKLWGLDAPHQQQITGADGGPLQVSWAQFVMAASADDTDANASPT